MQLNMMFAWQNMGSATGQAILPRMLSNISVYSNPHLHELYALRASKSAFWDTLDQRGDLHFAGTAHWYNGSVTIQATGLF